MIAFQVYIIPDTGPVLPIKKFDRCYLLGIIYLIWAVPHSKFKPHGLKYSLVYIREGKRIIGYDNAEMKGDHKHYRGKESVYQFTDVETLIKDFYEDVGKIKRGEL